MERTSYLSSLKFDPSLWNKWYAKYLVQVRLVIMLILAVVAMGFYAYINLPRRLNPEIKIPIVVISTVLPGASPEDVESLVTIPLEDKLTSLKSVDTLTSSSSENSSNITIQFLSTVDGDKAKDEVQSLVDSASPDLPTDALTPQVLKLDFEDQPIWNFAITTDGDMVSLTRISEELKDRLKDLPKVDRVTTSGLDTQIAEVIINPEKAKEYQINPLTLSQIVQKATNSYPAGNVQTSQSTFPLSIDKDATSLEDLRNLQITVNNNPIKLGDIADISFRSTPNQPVTLYGAKGEKAKAGVQFFVYKASTANIDAAAKDAQKEVETFMEGKSNFKLTTISNAAEMITKQFDDLTKDFVSTIILVFILLLIFLGLKQAIIASVTVPLTFFATFAIIHALGLSLNFLTMFAFLIALGLLIDDTIVTVAAMTRYFATGRFTPAQTGILVWKDFIVPLWSTTITTIWAFVPLLLATGIIGEFIKSIPIVVTATMISSTSIAVLITMPLMIIFLKPELPKRVKVLLTVLGILVGLGLYIFLLPKNITLPIILLLSVAAIGIFLRVKRYLGFKLPPAVKKVQDHGLLDIEKLSHRYMTLIERILNSKHGKRNTIIALVVFALFGYLLVPLGLVKNEFFPKEDAELLFVNVELPSGTNIGVANSEANKLLNQIKELPEIKFAIAESGTGFSGNSGRGSSGNSLLVTLHLTDKGERAKTSSIIAEDLRSELKDYSKGTLTVQEQSGGPPAGADVQVTLLGDDLTALDDYASRAVEYLKTLPGITNVNKSIKPGTSKIVFTPDKEKLAANNITVDMISLWLRTYATGFTLDNLKFDGDTKQDIIFKLSAEAQTPEELGKLSIPTANGNIPLLSLGKLTLATNPTIITREDGKRSISVTAAVVAGQNVAEKNKLLTDFITQKLNLPSGYSWKTGGVNEENQKSVNSIIQAMVISLLLILTTMVIEFRSFRQTFIALAIIPLSVAGVLYIFALTQTPLSFPALIGILSLFGIVVTHAIVVIEKINDNIREHLPLKEAIIDAAGNRLEPVLLTSLATIVGLTPITLSDPFWRGLGGAVIAGLLFSGAIKLFFVPVTYYLMFKDQKL